MKLLDNPNIPFSLFLFYLFHQLVMPEETPLQTLAVAVMLLYSIYAAIKLHQIGSSKGFNKGFSFIYALDVFLIIQIFYFIIGNSSTYYSSAFFASLSVNQIKSVLVTMMPIYTYFWYGINGKLLKKHIIWYSIIFIALSIPQFYYVANRLMSQYQFIHEYNETTNNIAYYFLQGFIFLPLLAKNKKISLPILFVIVFFLILGVKRGAILCFACALPFYLRHLIGKSRFYVIPIILVLFFVTANWLMDYFSDMSYLQVRIEQTMDGNSSSRNIYFAKIWDYVFKGDDAFLGVVFGHGFNESVNVVGNLAHNDWLELLLDFGIFSVVIYFTLICSIIKFLRKTKDDDLKTCLLIGLVIWFLQTFFSMAYASIPFQFIIIFGLCGISVYQENQRKFKKQSERLMFNYPKSSNGKSNFS